VIHALGGEQEMTAMGGLRSRIPHTYRTMLISTLAIAGVPGLAGFFSKDLVLSAVEGRMAWLPYAALLGTAFLTAFYMGRVLFVAFFGEARQQAEHAHEPGASMLGPLVLLAVPSVAVGWFGAPLAHMAGAEFHLHLGATPVLASALGLAGLGLAWVVYGRGASTAVLEPLERLAATSAVNRLYEVLFRRVMVAGADVLGWFDRYVVDGAMNFLGWSFVAGGRALRRVQTGLAQDYVFAVVVGAVALAVWGIWP
jgi:NADH-quinone oxidoreductase subunit L